MKLVQALNTRDGAAQHLENFVQRVRCGEVKRYVIVSLECSESDSSEPGLLLQSYRESTSVIEDLAFMSSLDIIKDVVKDDLSAGDDR